MTSIVEKNIRDELMTGNFLKLPKKKKQKKESGSKTKKKHQPGLVNINKKWKRQIRRDMKKFHNEKKETNPKRNRKNCMFCNANKI